MCIYIYIHTCLDLMTLVYSRYSHLYTQEMFGIQWLFPWDDHPMARPRYWLLLGVFQGSYIGHKARTWLHFRVCFACFLCDVLLSDLFVEMTKWSCGKPNNKQSSTSPFFWIEIIPSHGRFMSLGESCIMFWNSLTAKNSFLIAMCCKKKTRCWPSLSSTVGADESNWAHANGIALVRLVVTPIPS